MGGRARRRDWGDSQCFVSMDLWYTVVGRRPILRTHAGGSGNWTFTLRPLVVMLEMAGTKGNWNKNAIFKNHGMRTLYCHRMNLQVIKERFSINRRVRTWMCVLYQNQTDRNSVTVSGSDKFKHCLRSFSLNDHFLPPLLVYYFNSSYSARSLSNSCDLVIQILGIACFWKNERSSSWIWSALELAIFWREDQHDNGYGMSPFFRCFFKPPPFGGELRNRMKQY